MIVKYFSLTKGQLEIMLDITDYVFYSDDMFEEKIIDSEVLNIYRTVFSISYSEHCCDVCGRHSAFLRGSMISFTSGVKSACLICPECSKNIDNYLKGVKL